MRARVLVGDINRRRIGATSSGLIGKSSESGSLGTRLSPASSSSSFSGSMTMESVSTVADEAIAAPMISPWISRLSTRASISPSRNWLR